MGSMYAGWAASEARTFENISNMLHEHIVELRGTLHRTARLLRHRRLQGPDSAMKGSHICTNDRRNFLDELAMVLLPM